MVIDEDTCYWHLQNRSSFLKKEDFNKCIKECDGRENNCVQDENNSHRYIRIGRRGLISYRNQRMGDW